MDEFTRPVGFLSAVTSTRRVSLLQTATRPDFAAQYDRELASDDDDESISSDNAAVADTRTETAANEPIVRNARASALLAALDAVSSQSTRDESSITDGVHRFVQSRTDTAHNDTTYYVNELPQHVRRADLRDDEASDDDDSDSAAPSAPPRRALGSKRMRELLSGVEPPTHADFEAGEAEIFYDEDEDSENERWLSNKLTHNRQQRKAKRPHS